MMFVREHQMQSLEDMRITTAGGGPLEELEENRRVVV
jgi:hypothetical protein